MKLGGEFPTYPTLARGKASMLEANRSMWRGLEIHIWTSQPTHICRDATFRTTDTMSRRESDGG